jgi:2-polyprenyl-3-methyl-5-hydroxy-6-metoxy-1,4-benzoquinol methylase
MLNDVIKNEIPWTLGPLLEGWEWLAFTFNDQAPIDLTSEELNKMVAASDQIAKKAYSRMQLGSAHKWASYTDAEADFVADVCQLAIGQSVLDLGCGSGRHALRLGEMGFRVTGVDYIGDHMAAARERTRRDQGELVTFVEADCRLVDLDGRFDAVICLYDVIGSYADDIDNLLIMMNIEKHLKPGGMALLSVMNMELTEAQASNFFSFEDEPNKLQALRPSHTMERTGDVFQPDHYIVDSKAGLVYRKEQFSDGKELPVELLVRDRRYRVDEIVALCSVVGLEVVWTRYVHAGHWDSSLEPRHEKAKEILLLCRSPQSTSGRNVETVVDQTTPENVETNRADEAQYLQRRPPLGP